MIEGLSHLTFIVRDLNRMEMILTTVLDAQKVYDRGDETFSLSRERFFLVGGARSDAPAPIWIAIMEGESLPELIITLRSRPPVLLERVRALGLDVREGRSRVAGEGRSIYFHDDDNHLFELHTGTLDERLRRYSAGRPGRGAEQA